MSNKGVRVGKKVLVGRKVFLFMKWLRAAWPHLTNLQKRAALGVLVCVGNDLHWFDLREFERVYVEEICLLCFFIKKQWKHSN